MSCAERKRFVKKCGLLTSEHFGDNKQKISPNLAKRTDFLVHKAQVLVAISQPQLNGYGQPQNKAKSGGGKAVFFLDLQGFSNLISAETILAFPNTV